MTLRPITLAVGLALSGCTLPGFLVNKNEDRPRTVAAAPPSVVVTPAPNKPPHVLVLDEYSYRLLTPEQTGLRRVFDDGSKTFIQFASPTPPAGLMVFNENGKAVPFTIFGQHAVVDSVQLGLLVRTPTKSSYAQSMTPDRVARVLAVKPGEGGKAALLPAELAAARAQILEAQERLKGLATEVDKASRGEPSAPVTQLQAGIEQLQTQIAGITATMIRARFDSGSALLALSEATRAALVDAANRAQQVHIRGRTDAAGTPELNSQIALARAVAARRMLIAGGVPSTKLVTTYSRGDYIAPNRTTEGRAQNRRVELVFVGKGNERIQVTLADHDVDQAITERSDQLINQVLTANAHRAISLSGTALPSEL